MKFKDQPLTLEQIYKRQSTAIKKITFFLLEDVEDTNKIGNIKAAIKDLLDQSILEDEKWVTKHIVLNVEK